MPQSVAVIPILLFITRAFGASSLPNDDGGKTTCSDHEDDRTVWGITGSCLATMFACTWLAVHPNVPGRNIMTKGAISCAIERAKIIAITILAPEVILAWAAEQFTMEESKLTLAHGFLLSMGGFYYTAKYEIPHQPLEADEAASTLPSSSLAETIEDKSKGDALSKTFSILQISWFIVQCIARVIHHLPITLLEMTALAFAGLSIIMYFLWWHKPLNVKYHISLDGSESRPMLDINNPEESTSPVKSSRHRLDWFREWIGFTTFEGSVDGYCENIGDGACRFYSGTNEQQPRRFVNMVVIGSLFGAIHCVAWSFYFPSHAEMMLWHLSSITVLIGLFPVSVFLRAWRDDKTSALPFILICISVFMMIVAIILYIVARITLIILAFLQLRSLPQPALCAVQWTTYIPHM
ncbi:hypothetical protein ARMGADRAFT_949790 [Armillaria gallica]|uniref:Uncharacterized protein n=1 Tax=Armillaria gallica TaxID=47427 RepID=A0A2H3CU65_ARMGA|nr:hypothetical protein ARMGADRAFT_949790 [Armillaria gallica]